MTRQPDFGLTWWGRAWLDALEQRALVDPNRLPRGRTYARKGRVSELELSPGLLRAVVRGTEPYITSLSLRLLTDGQWDKVLDTIMARAANVATLLAGEVPESIGSAILPARGDLGPECSCPDWAEPCKHAAALCYVAANVFDADPFALLMLRGRSREVVLNEVRNRRSAQLGIDAIPPSSDLPRGADPGTSASEAYRRTPEPVDRSPALDPRPGELVHLAVAPSADSGVDQQALASLVADGAQRAWSMLAGGAQSGLSLTIGADVVRRAFGGNVVEVAAATGIEERELRAAVEAWRIGGLAGYQVHVGNHVAPHDVLLRAAQSIGSMARVRSNAVNVASVQLRVDTRTQWWKFRPDDELGWVLSDGPVDDPTELL